ncbi:MAG: hypothetical protein ACI4ND_01235, partial [Succinivibrio sp.]
SLDRNDCKNWLEIIFMCVLCSLLACLRREGLYLLFLGLFLIVSIYGTQNKQFINKKNVLIISFFILTQLIVFIPQLSHNPFGEKGTTYDAFIVHMLGSKLDRDISQDNLKVIEKKLDIAIVDKYNKELGYQAFADCMYSWPWWENGKYYAIKKDNTVSSDEYFRAISNVIKQQPLIYLKSRVDAFRAVNKVYPKGKVYVASLALLFIFLFSIAKRNLVLFVLTFGVLIHSIITILTMPASYIKYFYEMILFDLFFIAIIFTSFFKNRSLRLVKEE